MFLPKWLPKVVLSSWAGWNRRPPFRLNSQMATSLFRLNQDRHHHIRAWERNGFGQANAQSVAATCPVLNQLTPA